MIGSIVRHPRYGRGRVVGSARVGGELQIFFFDRGVTLGVSRLSVVAEGEPPRRRRIEPPGPPPSMQCREMTEALKLGVVPARFVSEFTCGRRAEIEAIERWLAGDAGALAVAGEYGSGKSHMLEYAQRLAMDAGWAVARAELDPEDAAPHNPFRVYRELVRGFRAPGDLDFRGVVEAAAGRGLLRDHIFFGPVVDRIRQGAATEEMWRWIEGERAGPNPFGPTMHDHTTAANLYCNLLTGLAHAAGGAAGLKGLVVALDEAESAGSPWLYLYQRERGPLFLEGLVRCAGDAPGLVSEVVARSKVDPTGPYRGVKTRLLYSGHNQASYAYRLPTNLKLLMAVAPAYSMVRWLKDRGVPALELDPLPEAALREAYERLFSLYRDAFPDHRLWNFEREGVFKEILQKCERLRSTRYFLKGIVEALELKRHAIQYPAR